MPNRNELTKEQLLDEIESLRDAHQMALDHIDELEDEVKELRNENHYFRN